MKKDFIVDYSAFILFKVLGPLVRILPKSLSFFLARRLGDGFYIFDLKHRSIAYVNIKVALGKELTPAQIRKVTRGFFQAIFQNMVEIFFIPLIEANYIKKFVDIEGRQHIDNAFKRGKGVIFLAVHAGSWELSNIISANLGFPFSMFVRQQRYPCLEKLLNSFRKAKGCRIIEREKGLPNLIHALKRGESAAMTLDQGGKRGIQVKFFGKYASMASGAVRLALKYDCSIIPVFPVRIKGPYLKFFVEPAFELKKSGNLERDMQENLQRLILLFERYIKIYPHEYLWSYKIWKYSIEKNVLILSDGKIGHLRQSETLSKILSRHFKNKGIDTAINTIKVEFKNPLSSLLLTLSSCLAGRYVCQGCLFCLRRFLKKVSYEALVRLNPDVIISCGSSLAGINYILAKENRAASFVIMRPSILSINRFDLVVMPRHDKPAIRKNIALIDGALNLIDESYLKEQSEKLSELIGSIQKDSVGYCSTKASLRGQPTQQAQPICIGVLIGGDSKGFHLRMEGILELCQQIKSAAEKLDAAVLISTSRRTPQHIEDLLRKEFKDYERCKLLVIANEKNYPFVTGGILGLSQVLIISAESVSMVSEAASSGRYVLVFGFESVKGRHRKFLDNLRDNNYIYLSQPRDLNRTLERILSLGPEIKILKDRQVIEDALK